MAKQTLVKTISESKARGEEPAPRDYSQDNEARFISDLNWYSWKLSNDSTIGISWILSLLSDKGWNTKELAAVKRAAQNNLIGSSTFSIARMISRGCTLPEDVLVRFEKRVKEAHERGRELREEIVEKIQAKDDRSPAQRNRDRALEFRAELDYLFDRVWEGELNTQDIKFFEIFAAANLARSQAAILSPIYKEELNEMIANKEELPRKKQAQQQILIDFAQARQEALEAWATGGSVKKTQQKTSAKKTQRRSAVNASTLKYKKNDDSLKLVSIDPQQIIGASTLIMYNTKYRQLTILRAADSDGLSIKGTTILNVDEKASETKRAGRDINSLREMASSTKTQVAKIFQSINSQLLEVRTRTSDEVILIKAFK